MLYAVFFISGFGNMRLRIGIFWNLSTNLQSSLVCECEFIISEPIFTLLYVTKETCTSIEILLLVSISCLNQIFVTNFFFIESAPEKQFPLMAKLCHYLYVCLVCERATTHHCLMFTFFTPGLDLKAKLTLAIQACVYYYSLLSLQSKCVGLSKATQFL